MYLLIVSGMSGAGKSLTLKALEENGFFCVDNLPSPMLASFVRMCRAAKPPIARAAVTIDSRESLLSRSPDEVLDALDAADNDYEVLFIDARDDVLRKRYNESRRPHPLGAAGEAASGVANEHIYLQGMRNRADYYIDSSDMEIRDLQKQIAAIFTQGAAQGMILMLSSFGYKRGVPVDADIVLDTRFVENPFYIPALRPLSGLDAPVRDFVMTQPYMETFLNKAEELLHDLLPHYQTQDKHLLRVAFGCTGGRHRSVAATEEMARRFRNHGQTVRIFHRDLRQEAEQIERRFETIGSRQ
ncbi:MAG: RNase adapter RapZ [Clostridiales bacterium]|nr:RNase adapter RapZ [Clostridiales bacterium]